MSSQPLPPDAKSSTQQNFCIHKKLKANNSHWPYAFEVSPYYGDAKYELHTCLVGKAEFSVYKRVDNCFVLVDFSDDYHSMNEEAKKIIDLNPAYKASVMYWEKEGANGSGCDANH